MSVTLAVEADATPSHEVEWHCNCGLVTRLQADADGRYTLHCPSCEAAGLKEIRGRARSVAIPQKLRS